MNNVLALQRLNNNNSKQMFCPVSIHSITPPPLDNY